MSKRVHAHTAVVYGLAAILVAMSLNCAGLKRAGVVSVPAATLGLIGLMASPVGGVIGATAGAGVAALALPDAEPANVEQHIDTQYVTNEAQDPNALTDNEKEESGWAAGIKYAWRRASYWLATIGIWVAAAFVAVLLFGTRRARDLWGIFFSTAQGVWSMLNPMRWIRTLWALLGGSHTPAFRDKMERRVKR